MDQGDFVILQVAGYPQHLDQARITGAHEHITGHDLSNMENGGSKYIQS